MSQHKKKIAQVHDPYAAITAHHWSKALLFAGKARKKIRWAIVEHMQQLQESLGRHPYFAGIDLAVVADRVESVVLGQLDSGTGKIWRSAEKVPYSSRHVEQHIRGLFFRCARDVRRLHRHAKRVDSTEVVLDRLEAASATRGFDFQQDVADLFRRANLSPQEIDIVRWRCIEKMSYAEIADRTGHTIDKLKTTVKHAKALLRQARNENDGLA